MVQNITSPEFGFRQEGLIFDLNIKTGLPVPYKLHSKTFVKNATFARMLVKNSTSFKIHEGKEFNGAETLLAITFSIQAQKGDWNRTPRVRKVHISIMSMSNPREMI